MPTEWAGCPTSADPRGQCFHWRGVKETEDVETDTKAASEPASTDTGLLWRVTHRVLKSFITLPCVYITVGTKRI